jgi:hypothetical protein
MFRIRQMIAGLLAWVGKVTLLFTLAGVGTGVVAYVLTRINTGAWPDAVVLGEPLRVTLQSIRIEPPPSPWAFLEPFWRFVLDLPPDDRAARWHVDWLIDDLGRCHGAKHSPSPS